MATSSPLVNVQPTAQPQQAATPNASTPAPMPNTTATKPITKPPAGAQTAAPKPVTPVTANKPLLIKGSTIEAPQMEFDPATMTVAGQMNGLLSSNNPYIRQARVRTAEESAARGLHNSSIAVQAGEEAAIAQALPIAQQDANTQYDKSKTQYGTSASAALNQQQFGHNKDLADQAFGHNTKLQAQQAASQLAQIRAQGAIQQQIAAQQQEFTKANMATEQANYLVRQGNEIAANVAAQTQSLDSQHQIAYGQAQERTADRISAEITAIYQNPEMKGNDRTTAITNVYDRWQKSSQFIDAVYNVKSSINTDLFK